MASSTCAGLYRGRNVAASCNSAALITIALLTASIMFCTPPAYSPFSMKEIPFPPRTPLYPTQHPSHSLTFLKAPTRKPLLTVYLVYLVGGDFRALVQCMSRQMSQAMSRLLSSPSFLRFPVHVTESLPDLLLNAP